MFEVPAGKRETSWHVHKPGDCPTAWWWNWLPP